MKQDYMNKYSNDSSNEIDLRELFYVLFQRKWFVIIFTSFLSIIGVIYSLSLPNIYESKTLLAPVNTSSGLSRSIQSSSVSSLAGLAGINLNSGGSDGNSDKALKKISSLSFFKNNLFINIFLPDLMAVKSWQAEKNELLYDENIYKIESNLWVRKHSYPQKQIPSAQESFRKFQSKHLSLSEDKKTGFVTLSIKHQSPYIAKKWVELIVDEVNTFYRQKDKLESEKAVNYLNKQISMTGLSEIKQVMAMLLQEETKKLTLIEANQYYVFGYIDPPAIMERKAEPSRAIICIFFALFGATLSIFLVLIIYYVIKKKTN